jgi:hypothetical protein
MRPCVRLHAPHVQTAECHQRPRSARGKSGIKSGESRERTLPPVVEQIKLATQNDIKFYDGHAPSDIGTPFPWSQRPRRIGIAPPRSERRTSRP